MAAPTLCKYLKPYTITANSNDDLRAESDGGAFSCTIAAGTYYVSGDGDSSDLLYQIETALNGADPGTVTWSLSISSNKVNIARAANTNAAYLYFSYSASGFNAFDPTWLGFDSIGTETIGATVDSIDADQQHPGSWYSTQAPLADPLPYYYDNEIAQAQTKTGVVYTVQVGELKQARDIAHAYEPSYRAYPVDGYTNESWLAFISEVADGSTVRYYPDVDSSTHWTGVIDRRNLTLAKPERLSPGVALHSWNITLLNVT